MTAMTRGPLPPRVYWRRRLLVLVVAVGLIIGTARLLALGSDGSSEKSPEATRVAAESTSSSPTEAAPSAVATAPQQRKQRSRQDDQKQKNQKQKQTKKRDRGPVLADPEGVCADRDVAVTPSVHSPVGGAPVTFTLELRTITTPACTWQVSPTTLTMKLTSGSDQIWSSQQCPRAIPKKEVVVRNNASTEVEVTWSARRSDAECSTRTEWAMPGWYFVDVAALAGEPSDLHFELEKPKRPARASKRDARRDRARDRPRQGG